MDSDLGIKALDAEGLTEVEGVGPLEAAAQQRVGLLLLPERVRVLRWNGDGVGSP